jgi:WD40 repeat protein
VVVTGLAVSPDRKLLYTGDSDGMLRAWEVTRDPPAEREVSRGPAVALEVLAFAPDGKTLLAGPYDHELHLFDATDPMAAPLVIRADPADGRPLRAAFGPDGRTVAVAHVRPEGACLCLWELTTPPRVRSRLAVEARPWSVAWSDDGRYLAVGLVGGAAVVWDVAGSEPKSVADLIGEVVAFAPGGRLLAGGKAGEGVRLHDLSTLPPRAGADFKANFRGMAFSADGRTLFVGEPLGRGLAFDVASPARERKTFNRSGGDVVALMPGAASFDLVTGDDAGQLFAWRGTDPAGSWRLPCPVRAWAAAPDGRHVAGAACDGRVYLFRIAPAP